MYSRLNIFFLHNGEYSWREQIVSFTLMCFNSCRLYSWREQMYSRFQRFVLFITVNILMEGRNSFTFLTLMCFLILTGECIHGGNKCIHVFNVDELFLFITVNILMEGTLVSPF